VLAEFANDMKHGKQCGFPFCCRLRYSLEAAVRYDPEQALKRGIRWASTGIEYVPCWIFHKGTVTHRESEHLLNIRAL
jgi:hypothetical protein